MRRSACVALLAGVLALSPNTAAAQGMSAFDIFGGYSFMSSENFGGPVSDDFGFSDVLGRSANHGFIASFTYNLTSALGIEVEIASHRKNSTPFDLTETSPASATFTDTDTTTATLEQKTFSLLFGPNFGHRSGGIRIFGHVLVGLVTTEETMTGSFTEVVQAGRFGGNNPAQTTTRVYTATSTIDGSAFGFVAGGGVDWAIGGGRWGIRVIQADFVKIPSSGDVTASFPQTSTCTPASTTLCPSSALLPDTVSGTASGVLNNFRVSTGVVVRFGEM